MTQESIAKTLDDLGLDERVITMLEYKNEDNDIVALQRTDALNKLSNVNPNEIKIKIQKTPIIVLCVLLLIFSGSLFLPKPSADTGNEPSEVIIPSEEDTIIKELLEKLREIIDKAEIEYELKDRLYEKVNLLEEELKTCTTTDQKVSLIKKAMKEIQDIIDYYLTERYMGEALQMYDPFTGIDFLTSPLGIAVSEKDLLGVDLSLDAFKEQLLIAANRRSNSFEELRDEYVKNLEEALKRATLEENEALITAISNFIETLKVATPENVSNVIDVAKEEIKKALMEDPSGTKEPEAAEDMKEEMEDAMQEAIDQLEKEEQETEDEIEQEGETDQEGEEETSPPPVPDEPLDSEPIIDGNTPYLPEYEKYAEIINQILSSYEGEEIPDEVRKVIEEYLKMLK